MYYIPYLLFFLAIAPCGAASAQPDQSGVVTPAQGATTNRPHGAYDPHKTLSPSQHIKVALQHKMEGRLSLAIDTLTQALANYGNNKQLLAVRSSLYLETRQLSAALKDINAALQLDPQDTRLLVNRADIYRQFGRSAEALSELDHAIALDQNMVAAFFNRGTINYQNGDYEKALEDFTRCIVIDPHLAGPYFNRAAVQNALGGNEAAIADLKRFMDLTDNESWKQKAEELLKDWEGADTGQRVQSKDNQ